MIAVVDVPITISSSNIMSISGATTDSASDSAPFTAVADFPVADTNLMIVIDSFAVAGALDGLKMQKMATDQQVDRCRKSQ